MRTWMMIGGALLLAVAPTAVGATLRDDLAQTAFVTTEKAVAIAQVNAALRTADGASGSIRRTWRVRASWPRRLAANRRQPRSTG